MTEEKQKRSLNQEFQDESQYIYDLFQPQEVNDFSPNNENQLEPQSDLKQHTSLEDNSISVQKNSQNEQCHQTKQGQINQEINNKNSQFQNSYPYLQQFLKRNHISSETKNPNKVFKNLFIKMVASFEHYPQYIDINIGLEQIEGKLKSMHKSWYGFCDVTQEINVEDNQNQTQKRTLKLDFQKIKKILQKNDLSLNKKVPFYMIKDYEQFLETLQKKQKEQFRNLDDDIQQIRDLIQYLQTVKQKKELNCQKSQILQKLYELPEITKLFDIILIDMNDENEQLLKLIKVKYQDKIIKKFKNYIQSIFEKIRKPSEKDKKGLKEERKFSQQVNSLSNSKQEEYQQDNSNFQYKEIQSLTIASVGIYQEQQVFLQSQNQQLQLEEQQDKIYHVYQNFDNQCYSPLQDFNDEQEND